VGPGDVSAGHLDLLSTVLPTAVAEIEGHFDLATILFLVTGAEVKGSFVLVDGGLPMTVGCWCYLAGTGFPANDLFQTLHTLGWLTRTLPGPGSGLCELATTFG